jgi:hypothetical protein
MTKEEVIALRRVGIFLPEPDSLYANTDELTKPELILKTLAEMGLLSLSEEDPQLNEKMRRIPVVVAELQRTLPDGEITTCNAFRGLGIDCCCLCHAEPLHYHRMCVVELPGHKWGWICCALMRQAPPKSA